MHLAKTVLLGVYDYFDSFEKRDGGRGALSRTSEAIPVSHTGIAGIAGGYTGVCIPV